MTATTAMAIETLGKTKKFRKRGKITKWLAVAWLVMLTFTAIGASWLPWVNHDCSQFAKKADCSTHVKGSALLTERPPAWATFANTSKKIKEGSPARTGIFGTDSNGFDIFARAMFGARNSLLIGGRFRGRQGWLEIQTVSPTSIGNRNFLTIESELYRTGSIFRHLQAKSVLTNAIVARQACLNCHRSQKSSASWGDLPDRNGSWICCGRSSYSRTLIQRFIWCWSEMGRSAIPWSDLPVT